MAVKLDMSKAYDRVEWSFLDAMMAKMGFHNKWRNWIMECLRTVTYSFSINGEVKEYVIPGRGIRQGDPLSPYLFLLCSEGFASLLRQAAGNKRISGMRLCRQGPSLTHLFFADDSLIFCKANKQQAIELMRVLQVYATASGQLINLDKSSILFSKNMCPHKKHQICHIMGNMQQVNQGKYLGLPMVVTRTKEQIFGFVRTNIQHRILKWKNRLLSAAGKETMLKAVSMAMPTYTMSCFKIPKRICKDISSLMSNYWWGEANGKNKVHWCSWKKLTQNKEKGGLGFKELEAFNMALLGKQVWRILTNPNLLVSKVLKAKYFPRSSIFECKIPKNASWIWRGLMAARKVVEHGVRKRIGNGRSTQIWEDRWIPDTTTGRVTTMKQGDSRLHKVEDLIIQKRWNRNLVFQYFNKEDAERILSIPISLAGREDSYFWMHGEDGRYSVSSGYKGLVSNKERSQEVSQREVSTSWGKQTHKMWKVMWRLKLKHKLKIFLWKCLNNALPVRELINGRTKAGDPICRRCGEEVETVEHLLLNCRETKHIWHIAPIQWDGMQEHHGCFKRWWISVTEARHRIAGSQHLALTVNILWQIWKARNDMEFTGKVHQPWKIIKRAQEEWLQFDEVAKKEARMSTGETSTHNNEDQHLEPDEGTVKMIVEATRQTDKPILGIGITAAERNQEPMIGWALKERSSGVQLLDDAVALKLAMCKANTLHQRNVQFQVKNRQLLNHIRTQKASDSRIATLVEDIVQLKRLFHMCSFCLASSDKNYLSSRISMYALGITIDEELVFPQC
ncbi:uncharacterized protein [Coffea arabica]|uniref:Reverse transcriptase domain-containing protein n=1 Tax=Coffea arabica TaxID=13443 RepID=A0A6P6V7X6_COFAR|nr:uncharacterized protein LOC113718066 [Coffea arabica]XP_027098792.1 uncharacterized protein LOC113718068 [Coffea arabica]